eukprot:1086744-Rhodomonas_salina.1
MLLPGGGSTGAQYGRVASPLLFYAPATRCPVLTYTMRRLLTIVLRICSTMSGTDLRCAATRYCCGVSSVVPLGIYPPTRSLCDTRYWHSVWCYPDPMRCA